MIVSGTEDLRVVKTIGAIKAAFGDLICRKDYEKITVKELCDTARIHKKTFYHYYETLDDLLAEMQRELSAGYLARIREFRLPEELDKVNREFFLYSAEQGLAYEKITCHSAYRSIRDAMVAEVTDAGWRNSAQFAKLSEDERQLLLTFVNSTVLTAYRQWVESGKHRPLEDVIEMTNRIVLGGVNGVFGK